MKILLITYNLGGSASGIVTERLANEMLKQGIDLKIITSYNKSKISKEIVTEVSEFIKDSTTQNISVSI